VVRIFQQLDKIINEHKYFKANLESLSKLQCTGKATKG